jgi:haloacetate dehalogenase
MATQLVEAMGELGFQNFLVAGHDRGARVAYRMALDHRDAVVRLAVLDVVPTVEMWDRMDANLAMANWHWLFLAQPEPFPEDLITCDPDRYYFRQGQDRFHPEALAAYRRAVHDPATVHAICEDYRAGATIDRSIDEEDRRRGARIRCPVLVLWSTREDLDSIDPLAIWKRWADDVRGRGIDSGHFLAEEAPDDVAEELRSFFS